VGIVADNNKAKLVPITIGRDDGRVVEVTVGLQPNDQVIQSPPDSLIDGETVRMVQPEQQGQAQPSGGGKSAGQSK
jgi:multidrug efflux pump subunit AcrA (membrane-fusion protein)